MFQNAPDGVSRSPGSRVNRREAVLTQPRSFADRRVAERLARRLIKRGRPLIHVLRARRLGSTLLPALLKLDASGSGAKNAGVAGLGSCFSVHLPTKTLLQAINCAIVATAVHLALSGPVGRKPVQDCATARKRGPPTNSGAIGGRSRVHAQPSLTPPERIGGHCAGRRAEKWPISLGAPQSRWRL